MQTINTKAARNRVAVLQAVKGYWRLHGCGPSLRDLIYLTGISSQSVIASHLHKLAATGEITLAPGLARTARPVDPPGLLQYGEPCPLCGCKGHA